MSLTQYLNKYRYTYITKENNKEISFKPISMGQLKNLLTYEGSKDQYIIEDILDEMITECVISDDFDINKLTLQDRFDLLLEIRRKSKGSKYQFNFKCPECKNLTMIVLDLDDLEVVPYPKDINFTIKLFDDFSVTLDFIRRGNQKDAVYAIKKDDSITDKMKLIKIISRMYANAMKSFDTPDGIITDSSLEDKFDLLDSLNETDYKKITDWYKKNDYGTVFKKEIKCTHCKHTDEIDIPVSGFFG